MKKGFFSQSENNFLDIPAGDNLFDWFKNVSFPVIILFWALTLSPNFEGRQDLIYKTPIIFFYSENNPDSLNRLPNTNLIAVH